MTTHSDSVERVEGGDMKEDREWLTDCEEYADGVGGPRCLLAQPYCKRQYHQPMTGFRGRVCVLYKEMKEVNGDGTNIRSEEGEA